MDINIDVSSIYNFFNLPPDIMLLRFLLTVGWIPIAITLLWGFFEVWVYYLQNKFADKQKYVLLAIDIPKGNDQSPKAVENLFAYIAGAHSTLNLLDKYWEGKFQLSFSFEIVSIGGYTQFLIRSPEASKNLVESAVYSQYPDAEITEVNDYTVGIPRIYPNDEYDVWGAEFIQARNKAYPIKTYKEFEHVMGKPEFHFRDPMASLMDLCSSLHEGEQLWYQLIVWPIGFDWPADCEKEISKILKEKPKSKDLLINKFFNFIIDIFTEVTGLLSGSEEVKKEDDALKMMNLKPKEKRQVEAITEKVGKLGFDFKVRMVYVAKKEVMNKPKVVNGFVGYMKQFVFNDLNNLKPDMEVTATSTSYLFKNSRLNERKGKIVRNYMGRSSKGRSKGLMNTEELATIWHFPIESVVKAPLIQKTPGRRAEPPMSLPMGEETIGQKLPDPIFQNISEDELFGPAMQKKPAEPAESLFAEPETNKEPPKGPPENLPFA